MKNKAIFEPDRSWRITLIIFCLTSLGLIFIGQHFDYSKLFFEDLSQAQHFIFNRTIRFLLNENLVLLLIYALFYEKKYVRFGISVELFGLFFLLIPYFLLRFYWEVEPMYISFIHRLIINPMLMLLLIPAIYIQKIKKADS